MQSIHGLCDAKIVHEAKKNVQFPKMHYKIPIAANKKNTRKQHGNMELPNIGFGDDTTGLTESVEDLQWLMQIMADFFKAYHLIINLETTK